MTLIEGDSIGPEISGAVVSIFAAAEVSCFVYSITRREGVVVLSLWCYVHRFQYPGSV